MKPKEKTFFRSSFFLVMFLTQLVAFQNCSSSFQVEEGMLDLNSSSNSPLVAGSQILNEALYKNKCASCHGSLSNSNLLGRVVTSDKIVNATNVISAMSFLKGTMTPEQISSLEKLFSNSGFSNTLAESGFTCNSSEDEKKNSLDFVRLSGKELQNSYRKNLPSSIWSNMTSHIYLLPSDIFVDKVSTALASYSFLQLTKVSEFNDKLSLEITSSDSQIAAFFGSCANSTSFTQACFNTFMNLKASRIFRSALASDDISATWAKISSAPSIPEQMKTLVQILFNDPRFIYHLELGLGPLDTSDQYALTSYEIANRIAFGMTESPPDDVLWADAVSDKLRTLSVVSSHVDRLSNSIEFQNRVVQFMKFLIGKAATNPPISSDFLSGLNNANLGQALETEYEDYVRYIIFNRKGNLAELFTSNAAFPKTTVVASIFGTGIANSATSPVLAPQHVGLITRPFFVLATAPNVKSVQRGRAIRMNLLCTEIPQPSQADLAARPALSEQDLINLSSRNYINKATLAGPTCIACHSKMNEIGFTLGHYDSIGRYINTESIFNSSGVKVASHLVNSVSTPSITESDSRVFNDAFSFQESLYKSDSLQRCMTTRSFEYFSRQVPNVEVDSCRLQKLDNILKKGKPLVEFFTDSFKQINILYRKGS